MPRNIDTYNEWEFQQLTGIGGRRIKRAVIWLVSYVRRIWFSRNGLTEEGSRVTVVVEVMILMGGWWEERRDINAPYSPQTNNQIRGRGRKLEGKRETFLIARWFLTGSHSLEIHHRIKHFRPKTTHLNFDLFFRRKNIFFSWYYLIFRIIKLHWTDNLSPCS